MDKRQIRKFKRMEEAMRLAESRYTHAFVRSMSETSSEDTIGYLEASQRTLQQDIQKIKALLDGSFDGSKKDIIDS